MSTEALKKCRENILTEKTLLQFGLITQKEYGMLKRPFTEDRQIVQGCVIVEWLGLTTAQAKENPEPIPAQPDIVLGIVYIYVCQIKLLSLAWD